MLETIFSGILGSKKALVALIGAIAAFVLLHWCGLSPEEVAVILGPLGLYEVGQGIADFGKGKEEAAK